MENIALNPNPVKPCSCVAKKLSWPASALTCGAMLFFDFNAINTIVMNLKLLHRILAFKYPNSEII